MHLSWKNYLRCHPFVDEFNLNAEKIQKFYNPSDPTNCISNCFRQLVENKSLVCISRIPATTEIQATFFHSTEKESFQQEKPYNFGLIGFGCRANAVRLNPDLIFTHSSQQEKVPTFEKILACEDTKSILDLP